MKLRKSNLKNIKDQINTKIWFQASKQVIGQQCLQVWNQVRTQVYGQVWDQVYNQIYKSNETAKK